VPVPESVFLLCDSSLHFVWGMSLGPRAPGKQPPLCHTSNRHFDRRGAGGSLGQRNVKLRSTALILRSTSKKLAGLLRIVKLSSHAGKRAFQRGRPPYATESLRGGYSFGLELGGTGALEHGSLSDDAAKVMISIAYGIEAL
jgi:hypothetical protein